MYTVIGVGSLYKQTVALVLLYKYKGQYLIHDMQ